MAGLTGKELKDLQHFKRSGRHGNFIEVSVLRAYNIPWEEEQDGFSFPGDYHSLEEWYVRVVLGGIEKYSTLIKPSPAPRWEEVFAFEIIDGRVDGKIGEELDKAKCFIEIRETIAGQPSHTDKILGVLELEASRLITEYTEGEHNLYEPGGSTLLVGDDGLDSLIKLRFRSGVLADNPSSDEASWWRAQAQQYRRENYKGSSSGRDDNVFGPKDTLGDYPAKPNKFDLELQQNRVWLLYKGRQELPVLDVPELPYIDAKDLDRTNPNKDYLSMLRHMGVTPDKMRILTDWFNRISAEEDGVNVITEKKLNTNLASFGYHFGVTAFLKSWRESQDSAETEADPGAETDLQATINVELFLRILAEEEAAEVQGLITNIKNPEINIQELLAELEVSRKGMELLRKYKILPNQKVGVKQREVWSQAEGKLAKVTGLKTYADKEVQADEDPFSQSLYIHYLPSKTKATGLAGQGSGKTDQVKKQQSRVWLTTLDDVADEDQADMIRMKPKTYEERLQEIQKGKKPASIHELSYSGISFMDAALKPGEWYMKNQPGTMAVLRNGPGEKGVNEYSTIKHSGNSAHMDKVLQVKD